MNNTYPTACENAVDFVKYLFKIYLEDRNFPLMISMLHEDVSWFGTGAHELCRNYREAVSLLEAERDSWDGHFKITHQWYTPVPINNDFCVVYGELKLIEDGLATILMEMDSRFSMFCILENGEYKLYHAHFSVPNAAQSEDEFVHKSLIQDYNTLLEEKLVERTRMLKAKTHELETLANNIYGGVEICEQDAGFTIHYMSDGFLSMTGYTAQEIFQLLGNKHIGLILPDDREKVYTQLANQLEKGDYFSLEYRIVRKDGSIIWVLDKGILIPRENDTPRIQCILTDITVQKEHEEELRISQKRYEVAMQVSNITMFEYNIATKQLILSERDANMYGLQRVLENGVESFINKGVIEAGYVTAYRDMYQKIHDGQPFAKCYVNSKDTNGITHDFELSLTTVYDAQGKPIRAIGVRKNVTQIRLLQRENEFGKTLALGKQFICEVDITNDRLLSMDREWSGELGAEMNMRFSEVIERLCKERVPCEYRELVLQKTSRKNIIETFEKGERLITFQYKRLGPSGTYYWCEATINIIRDNASNSINIRYYTVNIDERKKKEQQALEEQRLYETVLSHSFTVYEVNLTHNLFLSGHEEWGSLFGITPTNNFSEMMEALLDNAIHPDDAERFRSYYLLKNILSAYSGGKTELVCEYRRPNADGDFIWVRSTLRLFEDLDTGDIRAYVYIEDIDSQKRSELALVYKAEHDPLTGFYNKATIEKLITDFLSTADAKVHKHAFIMIDIDYFKSINDNFGHVFGDAVLSQTSAKIASLFREDDFLGRVGGDEFVVFMKNIYNNQVAATKAEEIRALLCGSYSQRGKVYNISASIGVTIYPTHGKNYNDLFFHSDSALYASKKNGRNQFSIYNSTMELVESNIKQFNPLGLLEVRSFEDNVSEYVFRILYESKDKDASIRSVLALIGKQLSVSRAYIFEDSPDGLYTSNTYEWCNEGVHSCIDNLQAVPYEDLDNYKDNFNDDGIFYMPDINQASKGVQATLEPKRVKSMLQFAITKDSKIVGFIGFDQCDYTRVPTRKEVSDCHNIAQILGVFIMEMRSQKQRQVMDEMAMSIVNALDTYAYVCDPADHSLLFINDSTMGVAPKAAIGQKCYQAFWARETPCEECPVKSLIASKQPRYSMELHNPNLNLWIKATASWISWQNNRRVCLVDSVDITMYKHTPQ
ncbi:MAG: diguanylate cyclase [Angelakisella sp.]